MPGEPRWSYYRPRAYAKIAGIITDVVKLQLDYDLSGIPRCILYLPVGRRADDPDTPATIHDIIGRLTEEMPIEVFVKMTPHDSSDGGIRGLGIPAGEFKIFEGLTSGGGYVRGTSAAQYMITGNHWLVHLNQASALSDSSHPGNPSHYSYGAIMLDGTEMGTLDWTELTRASHFINMSTLALDVWGDAFYPWFVNLTKQDGLQVIEIPGLRGEGPNKAAAAALQRLKAGGKCYKPLKFRRILNADIAAAAAQAVSKMTTYPGDIALIANQTLWDVLLGKFAADFSFAVVPRVSDAIVVPYISGYRGDRGPFAEILAGEYSHVEINTAMPRPLRGFGLLSAFTTYTGATTPPARDGILGLGGWYSPPGKDGAVIFDNAPPWLSTYLTAGLYAADASGGALKPGGNAVNPGEGVKPKVDVNANALQLKGLLYDMAKCRYAAEVLRGRFGMLSGPLRFDIAPGSLVRIEGAGEGFIAPDKLGQPYYAQVLRVSIMLDAETPSGGVAFHLGNVRTEAENKVDTASVAEHPLYVNTFAGCALVDP